MRRFFRRILPSMFYRRLLLLTAAALAICLALGVQMFRLTVVQGQDWRQEAESALRQTRLIPTVRGRILDWKGRPLAEDVPGYDVAVSYDVLTGEWAYRQARLAAYEADEARWNELGQYAQERLAQQYLPPYEEQVKQMWLTLCDLTDEDPRDLEERRTEIVSWVQRVASHLWDNWRRERQNASPDDQPVGLAEVVRPIHEQTIAHAVVHNLDSAALARVRGFIAEAGEESALSVWQQISIEPSKRRVYPMQTLTVEVDRSHFPGPLKNATPQTIEVDGVAMHVIGGMREIWKEDVDGPQGRPFRTTTALGQPGTDFGGYLPGDERGHRGIEESQEYQLRGWRGQEVKHLDSRVVDRQEPSGGHDVVLSLDIQLQARVQALLMPELGLMRRQPWHEKEVPESEIGQPLNGAAVVLDVATGQVLAAVSMPAVTQTPPPSEPDPDRWMKINRPWMNRVVAMPYQPGSTVKPMVLVSAITAGVFGLDQMVTCNGYLRPTDPEHYRCWIYKHFNGHTHGSLHADEAIQHSCNVFFYTLGRELGAGRLARWYSRFGLGAPTGCGLGEEMGGDLPDPAHADTPNARGFEEADAINMGIGQGPVRWTPIQAANVYATIARGGIAVTPTFLASPDPQHPQEVTDLGLDRRGVALAMHGLDLAVNTREGTGNHINYPDGQSEKTFDIDGVEIYGKSGTADTTPGLRIDSDGDGRITSNDQVVNKGDHAWLIALVQRPGSARPDFVVVVVVEYAGSGGRVSGPIANQILYAMRAEGYL